MLGILVFSECIGILVLAFFIKKSKMIYIVKLEMDLGSVWMLTNLSKP
jgi:hypothetical protein